MSKPTVKLFIPHTHQHDNFINRSIRPGSGIVGVELDADETQAGNVLIYYEGNIYNADNIKTYEDKCFHAWSRMSERYPTVARMVVPRLDLVQIGSFDPNNKTVVIDEITPVIHDAAMKWIGDQPRGPLSPWQAFGRAIGLAPAHEARQGQ
jgi:hypothetical protein